MTVSGEVDAGNLPKLRGRINAERAQNKRNYPKEKFVFFVKMTTIPFEKKCQISHFLL